MRTKYVLIILFLITTLCGYSQSVTTSRSQMEGSSVAMDEVVKAIKEERPDAEVAESYEKLAKDLAAKGDYVRAEDYLTRAKKLYEKIKDKEKIAVVERELAKVQESQNKLGEAIDSYKRAGRNSSDERVQQLNNNDFNRLISNSTPAAQKKYIKENIKLSKDLGNKDDQVFAYKQMAQADFEMNDAPAAIKNLEQALVTVEDQPRAMEIKREIANVYAATDQMEKAIDINKDLIAEAKAVNNPTAEIRQLQTLSENYFDANKAQEGLAVLTEAYNLSIENNRTIEAKNSLELLVEQYNKMRQPQKALAAYDDFIKHLESLVANDSTLVDDKFFHVQEEKILQLENERALKDELIAKKNTFNYVLLIAISLILVFLVFLIRGLLAIKKKNKRIALQSLRREMNPHFIFNSLNSVNQFIAQNNELEANKYLSSYSKLMRNIMENSNKDFISLTTELDQLKEYLDLEYMRFHDKFTYQIVINDALDTDAILVPNMLIQPQLENAIWHGLRYKDSMGLLVLDIKENNGKIIVTVEDNGIGLTKSKELKTRHQKEHNSRGLTNTQERIRLLNNLYNTNIIISVTEKTGEQSGVIVTLEFPLINKAL